MKITDLIKKEAIDLNVKASTKKEIIEKAVELMAKNQNITNKEDYLKLVLEREEKGTTGIGEEIAIPHGKGDSISSPGVSAMVIPEGTDFNSLDGKPVKLLFLIAAPNTEDNVHLEVLSRLSSLLMDENFRKELIKAKSKEEFLEIIDNAEKKAHNKEEKKSDYELLGITACPTGIAHTYMAAEALEKMGEELGHFIKVETQGQSGAQNILTEEEIKNAKAIIVAADVNVDLSRFNGKKVLKVGVSEGIHNPKKLIEKALKENSEIPIYHKNENSEKEENLGGNVYRHLMNGVTHMLPFVVGGGILIAIAFLLDDYSINPSNFGMNTPIAAFFKTIGGIAFDFMLIILSGYIAMSIGDRPGLAVGIVGGAIAKAGTTFSSLMNSEEVLISSGFLGALIAGFLGGFIIKFLKRLFKFIPKSLEGIRTILIYPVAGILLIGIIMLLINPFVASINTGLNNFLFSMSGVNKVIGLLMTFVVEPIMGGINTGLNNALTGMGSSSKVILGIVLGGMMAIDMGGPFNKAAYVFGTAQLTVANAGPEQFEIMAAVMIGGMVAPLAIAILATFFPKKLPKKERQAGLLNYVMGLSFISEGAIPFASADPIRVLPACVIGSAVSGALSMAFNCSLMAPHGGIFVLPLIGNPGWYTLALVVGSVIAAGIMAIFKKNVWENTV